VGGGSGEDGADVRRFVFDLPVVEAQGREAAGGVGLVAEEVAGLLGGGAVVAHAVGLDHEAEVGPVEVDFEAVDPPFGERLGKAGGEGQRSEEDFELAVGEAEGVAVEHLAEAPHARFARALVEPEAEHLRVDPVEDVGLIDEALQRAVAELRRLVEGGAGRSGHRDAAVNRHVLGR
jgi:hypothetical protein